MPKLTTIEMAKHLLNSATASGGCRAFHDAITGARLFKMSCEVASKGNEPLDILEVWDDFIEALEEKAAYFQAKALEELEKSRPEADPVKPESADLK